MQAINWAGCGIRTCWKSSSRQAMHVAQINLVFLLEEDSAKHLLETLLPQIVGEFPAVHCRCIPHQGKNHLQQSIPRKLKTWNQPNTFFVILHDQDSRDCRELKQELQEICARQSKHTPLIRIVCRELEAWYFGDLDAVEKAFPKFEAAQYRNKKKYRNPDDIDRPGKELKRIGIDKGFHFQKGDAAKKVPRYMDIKNNSSKSFQHLVTGVQKLVRQNIQSQQG